MQASVDVRNGLLTREEGMNIAKSVDKEKPYALDYYLKITGLSEDEFLTQIQSQRNPGYSNNFIEGIDKTVPM